MKLFTIEEDREVIKWCNANRKIYKQIYDTPTLNETSCCESLLQLSFKIKWKVAAICYRIVELTLEDKLNEKR